MRPTNSVKNIEWWCQTGVVFKVISDEWWCQTDVVFKVISDEWQKLSDEKKKKKPNKALDISYIWSWRTYLHESII